MGQYETRQQEEKVNHQTDIGGSDVSEKIAQVGINDGNSRYPSEAVQYLERPFWIGIRLHIHSPVRVRDATEIVVMGILVKIIMSTCFPLAQLQNIGSR
jgi:hypothetical protein